jgi:hypothetical protein
MGNCPTRSPKEDTIRMKEGTYYGEYKIASGYNHDHGEIVKNTKVPCGKGSLILYEHASILKIEGMFDKDGTISQEEEVTIHPKSGESFTGVVRQTVDGYEVERKPSSHNSSVNNEEIPQPSTGRGSEWEKNGEKLARQQEREHAKQKNSDQRIASEKGKQNLQKSGKIYSDNIKKSTMEVLEATKDISLHDDIIPKNKNGSVHYGVVYFPCLDTSPLRRSKDDSFVGR